MTERIGDWVIEGPIGSGGMGTVYRCHNVLTPRIQAAVKIIRPDRPDTFRERFLREVESLEALHHPAVVRVKGWGEQDGMLWLAMDLVEGMDLEDALYNNGALSQEAAVRVFSDVASGLAHAHERNVIHRDVKPANILIMPNGDGRIVDFGIAVQDGRTRLTAAGAMNGTPAYMAPETFGGNPTGELLDIYALGQALHESLTGEVAFPQPEGLTTTQQLAHVVGLKMKAKALDPGPGFPDYLREVVRRSTEPQPAKRIATMRMFADALAGGKLPPMQGASDTIAIDFDDIPNEPELAPPPVKRRRGLGFITGALGATVVFGSLLMLLIAGAGAAAYLYWPASGREIRVTLTDAVPGTPTAVWIGRERAQPEIGGTTWFLAGADAHALPIRVITGEACDVDAWDGGECLPCCSCEETTAHTDAVQMTLAAPSDTALLALTTTPVRLPWTIRAQSDTLVFTEQGRGSWRAHGGIGVHEVVVTAGTCPEASLGCGTDCPPGCESVRTTVELACGEETREVVLLQTPRRPLEVPRPSPTRPEPAVPDSAVPAPTEPVHTQPAQPHPAQPLPPTVEPTRPASVLTRPPTRIDKPGMTPVPSPSGMTRPAPITVPSADSAPSPAPNVSGWSRPDDLGKTGWTNPNGTLNGVSVLVRYRATDIEQARIAVSRLQRRGASVRSEEYERAGADAHYGRIYYANGELSSSAGQASSTIFRIGSHTRMMRDWGTGDDIVIFLEPS
jgi:hypothetical protein